jgi:predicted alpha/beta superfamily hydrolase
MIGSSMGGLATLYALSKFSDSFHTALSLSPHWVLAGDPLVDYLVNNLPNRPDYRVWMSRGTKGLDASYLPYQNRADELMRELSWGSRYRSKVYHRTTHNERSWASYVDEPLKFWLT